MGRVDVSVIIPAYNEEEDLPLTLAALKTHAPALQFEVIVVDNGSTDRTAEVATHLGAKVVSCASGTIAATRNAGVRESHGAVLVFIDADVHITPDWQTVFPSVYDSLLAEPMTITGSRCLPPQNQNWLNRYWFARLAEYEAPYINSGHLITTRELHDVIGGFTEALKTAEDYDYCMKAKEAGTVIRNNAELPVIHVGYPSTVGTFIRRERWHGREDYQSITSFLESKVAWVATFHFIFLLSTILMSVVSLSIWPWIPYGVFTGILCLLLTVWKYGSGRWSQWFQTSCVFYVYVLARGLAGVDRLLKRSD